MALTQVVKPILITALVTGLITLTGCGQNADDKNQVIARVDGHVVKASAFDAYLKHKNILGEKAEAERDKYLDHYLEREALTTAIDKAGVLDQATIEVELAEFKRQLLIGRYFEKHLKNTVSEQSLRNYYSGNADKYQQTQAQVAHMLLRTNSKMSEAEKKALRTKADEAYSKLMMGESFEAIVTAYSEDRVSAKKGGDLGWLKEGAIDPQFSTTVFDMTEGDISQPFETPFGFHIVKLLKAPQTIQKPFETVKGDIRYMLRSESKKAEKERLLNTVKIEKKR